jgi:hypothetical protein
MDALTRSIWKNVWGRLDGVEPTPGGGDPYFANVVLLYNFDTPSTTDVTGKTAALIGNAAISGGALVLDGNGDSLYLNASSADFAFGTGDYTIEFVCTKSGNGALGYDTAIDWTNDGNSSGGFFVELSSSRGFVSWGDNAAAALVYSTNPNDGSQHYWAVKRSGTTKTLWKDGSQVASQSNDKDVVQGYQPRIGGTRNTNTFGFKGSINAIRITKGVARDVSVIPTLPFPES